MCKRVCMCVYVCTCACAVCMCVCVIACVCVYIGVAPIIGSLIDIGLFFDYLLIKFFGGLLVVKKPYLIQTLRLTL